MKLDPTGEGAPYLQVAELLRQGIREGRWKPGEKLPSAPALARDLEVAKMTALRAVQVLQDEGLVVSRVGSGTYVTPARAESSFADVDPRAAQITANLYGLSPESMATEVPRLVAHHHERYESKLRVRVVCAASERFSWTWQSGKPRQGDVPQECEQLLSALDRLNLPGGVRVEVRGRRTLPELELTLFEMVVPDRTTDVQMSYARPARVKIQGAVPWGPIDAGEVALEWFEREWK